MIIIQIMGGLGNQIAQYAFGLGCARRLGVSLKLDITSYRTYELHAYALDRFTLDAEVATDAEIATAKANIIVRELTLLFDPDIESQVVDGVYLSGYWGDYRYSAKIIEKLRSELLPHFPMSASNLSVLTDIRKTDSVSVNIRRGDYVTNPNCLVLPLTYYEDSIRELTCREPNAHAYIFSDDLEWVEQHLRLDCPHTFVRGNDASRNVDDFQLMRSCKHHIIANSTFSFWAAMLDGQNGLVFSPQQYFLPGDPYLLQSFGRIDQPVWPPAWVVIPIRSEVASTNYIGIAGGDSGRRPIRVGVWNYYESLTTDGFIFKHSNASIGHNLLKPWCDLYAYGQANGIHFVTLDQVSGPEELDAVIFQDRPRMNNPLVDRLLGLDVPKYLCLFETEVIKPDNWDKDFHSHFDRIFTWSDAHVDHRRYIKQNFAIDPESPYDFEVLKTAFHQRKLCTLIAGAKGARHPNELYSERIRAIQWFQTHAPQDFDFYGIGWNPEAFPAYRGAVQDKLATLARYRFAICYENARNYPGYITEKILDCFRAGVVPVYLGAPNIDQWIPRDCFIDRNDFQSEDELHAYLASMGPEAYGAYLDRIRDLLASPKIYPFSTEYFITTLTAFVARDVKVRRGECPDVSVVIPAYNYGRYLRQAVQSALDQEVDQLEVLVLDNASTDETKEVLAEFAGDARLRCVRNTRNIGAPYNWNNAFQTAAGRYITVLSADDYFLPGHLGRMMRTMDGNPAVSLAYCPCIWVDGSGNTMQVMNHVGHLPSNYVGGRNEVADLLAFDCYITPSAAVIRRSAMDLVGKMVHSLSGAIDWDLWIRLAEQAPDFAFFKEPLVCYRVHGENDTYAQLSKAALLKDHFDILWNAIGRGSLSLFKMKATEILGLLKRKFNAYPPHFVAHLGPHVAALERILTGHEGVDFASERRRAEQWPPHVETVIAANAVISGRPLVTVIIPTHNRPELLDRSLASIDVQTYPNVEVIVVNDAGCPVEHIIGQHHPSGGVRCLVHEVNKGAAAARNSGLRLAKGEYIAYLDDDDEFLPDHLSVLVDALQQSSCRLAYSRAEYLVETESGGQVQLTRQRPFDEVVYSRELLLVGNFIPTPTWLFERSLITDAGLFDESFKAWEDWEWLVRASGCTEFLSIPKITVEVHQRPHDGGHLGVKHRPEMQKWFEAVYEKHPTPTSGVAATRAEYLRSLFPDAHASGKMQIGTAAGVHDEMVDDPDFLAASQGSLDIVDLINRAEGLIGSQRPDLAAALYRLWLGHTQSALRYAIAFNLGATLENVGALVEAEQAYRQAVAYNSRFVPPRQSLASLLERTGKLDEALVQWRWICRAENGVQASHPDRYESAVAGKNRLQNAVS